MRAAGAVLFVCMILGVGLAHAVQDYYEEAEVVDGGAVFGRVVLLGDFPAPGRLIVGTDTDVCGKEPIVSRQLLVGPDGGVQNAVVHLEKVHRGKKWTTKEYTLRQKNCRFEPHILLVVEGADLHVVNRDRIPHNVRSQSLDAVFNIGQPRLVVQLLVEDFASQLGDSPISEIGCAVHPWMKAYAIIQKHPYYAVTSPDGSFQLTEVPPGRYELKLWHEKLGEESRKITVSTEEETSVTFELIYPGQ